MIFIIRNSAKFRLFLLVLGVSRFLNQSSGLSDLHCWLNFLSFFRSSLGNSYHFDMFNNSEITLAEDLLCDDILRNWVFQDCSRYRRKFNINTFPNRRKIFKLVKIIQQQILQHLSLRSPRRNVHVLSRTLHTEFNSAFNLTADIWSMYSRVPFDIFWFTLENEWLQVLKSYPFSF